MPKEISCFKKIINKIFKKQQEFEIICKNINISIETKEYLLDEVIKYLFDITQKSTEKKVFDYEHDFKYYFYDFLKLGINLNTDDVSWWEFDSILEGLFLDSHCSIGQVIQYRTYEKPSKNPKISEAKENKFYMDKKRQYALPLEKSNAGEGLEKLWNYVEKKAGDDLSMTQK